MINEDRRIFRLEAESTVKVAARLSDIAMFEFGLPSDKIGNRSQHGIALTFEVGKRVGINLPVPNNFGLKIALIAQAVGGREGGEIAYGFRAPAIGRRRSDGLRHEAPFPSTFVLRALLEQRQREQGPRAPERRVGAPSSSHTVLEGGSKRALSVWKAPDCRAPGS